MKKDEKHYMSLSYPAKIEEMDEGFCAFIPMIKGYKAFGETVEITFKELEAVKEGFFDVFLKIGKPIPESVIQLDIPYDISREMKHREDLESFVVY